MQCPSCQTTIMAGQKFCGVCGRQLEMACPQCGTANPPHHSYCSQCGTSLTETGAITLARSGLITQINEKAWKMLGHQEKEMKGKPFSLFVDRADMVIFFSHLNELLSTAKKQAFEITLKHKTQNSVYVLLECRVDDPSAGGAATVQITLTEITDSRMAAVQMQTQQELLALIFTVAHQISTVTSKHLGQSIEDALKKICLFTKAERCFIYGINRPLKRLEPAYEWRQPPPSEQKANNKPKSTPLSKIKQTLLRLRQEKVVVVHDAAKLDPLQCDELTAWLPVTPGALIAYLVYAGKMPTAIIGVLQTDANKEWTPDCVSLVKFFGDFVASRLPSSVGQVPSSTPAPTGDGTAGPPDDQVKVIELSHKRRRAAVPVEGTGTVSGQLSGATPKVGRRALPDMSRPMLLEKFSGDQTMPLQQVFPRDDGLVMLTCPACGTRESVPLGRFEKMGNSISVNCPCGNPFAAVLEKRHHFRKSVHLEGYFSLSGDLGPVGHKGSIWGPMVVKDLSKAGLRFSSEKANLVHPGDLLMVRFNLDNNSQALIHKAARVINVGTHGVGCRFEGADNYDITLGFYFM